MVADLSLDREMGKALAPAGGASGKRFSVVQKLGTVVNFVYFKTSPM